MIRKAVAKDIPRIAEIIVFGKRVAYRPIFQNDMVSFNEMQVVSTADERLLNRLFCRQREAVKREYSCG